MREADADGYVLLGAVSRLLGMQSQYLSRYLTGASPVQLGGGLRIDLSGFASGGDYHAIRVHAADVPELVARVTAHRRATGQIA